jgi:hypothetical protein
MAGEIQGHQNTGGATARGKPDPNVKLPGPVKAAAERAEALSAQAKAAREANEASGANQPIGQSATVPTTKPFGAQGGGAAVVTAPFDPKNPNPPGEAELRLQPQQQPPQQQPPAAPQAPQPQGQTDWEHQFNSLKGRYDQETQNNRNLSRQVTDMQRLLATIGAPSTPAPGDGGGGSGVRFSGPITGQGQPQPQRRITPQEATEYGPELLDVMGRRAQEIFEANYLPQVMGELNQVKRQIGGVANNQVFDARVRMYDDLAREVPNWSDINNSPAFAAWLDQIDPVSMQSRRFFLDGAHNGNQTGQVVNIFKSFLATQAALGLQGGNPSPGNGAGGGYSPGVTGPAASTPQMDLTAFAAPGRAKPGQTQVPPEKPIFTRADITQFYRDKTAGRFAGREAEADALERQLFEAGNEGRIR